MTEQQSIDMSKLETVRERIAQLTESREARERREAQEWEARHAGSIDAPLVTVDRERTYRTANGVVLTESEAVEYRNSGAFAGAVGVVDYDHHDHHREWEGMAQANPDGNTTGEHVPGTVDGTGTTATDRYAVDRFQSDRQRSPHLEVPTFHHSTSGVRFIDHRPRAFVARRPQGAVTVKRADGSMVTVLPGGTFLGYDGTRETASVVNGKQGGRPRAECDECTAATNGECDKCERRRADRERKRRQRERKRTTAQREQEQERKQRERENAMASASAGWDTDSRV